jgi:hypothetical protein
MLVVGGTRSREGRDRQVESADWRIVGRFSYSNAQRPDPHAGRPQPRFGLLDSPQMGKELDRPE